MPDMLKAADAAIEEAGKAIAMLGRKKPAQVGATEEHAFLKGAQPVSRSSASIGFLGVCPE